VLGARPIAEARTTFHTTDWVSWLAPTTYTVGLRDVSRAGTAGLKGGEQVRDHPFRLRGRIVRTDEVPLGIQRDRPGREDRQAPTSHRDVRIAWRRRERGDVPELDTHLLIQRARRDLRSGSTRRA
jgi:hypothetical protein